MDKSARSRWMYVSVPVEVGEMVLISLIAAMAFSWERVKRYTFAFLE